jgi:hypothetical protein
LATHTTSAKKSSAGELFDALGSFYHRRWLLKYFIQRQVTRSYKRSYLGFAWAILGPLVWVFFLTLIFSEVVGLRFREVEEDPNLNFGLFLYCGLLPFLAGMRRLADVRRVDLAKALLARLPWELRSGLDDLAPTHIEVPSGSRIRVDYSDPAAPVLAVKLQEVFGMLDTPRIAGGRVALTVHLLSPARRPVQVTQDLASFWREGYFEVRKDLRGRYPKHPWPEDPLTAPATRRLKGR